MSQCIFISSVQREFAKERKVFAEYVPKDAILGRFFDVFLFEEVPAQERKGDGVYLAKVDACDICLGIFGHTYGNVDSSRVSATEREYLRVAKRHKTAPKHRGDGWDEALESRLFDTLREESFLDQIELSRFLASRGQRCNDASNGCLGQVRLCVSAASALATGR